MWRARAAQVHQATARSWLGRYAGVESSEQVFRLPFYPATLQPGYFPLISFHR